MATPFDKKRVSFDQIVKNGLEDAPLKQENDGNRIRRKEYWDDDHSMREIRSKDRKSRPMTQDFREDKTMSGVDKMVLESRKDGRTQCVTTLMEAMQRTARNEYTDEELARIQASLYSPLKGFDERTIRLVRRRSDEVEDMNEMDEDSLDTIPEVGSEAEPVIQEGHGESSRWSVWTEESAARGALLRDMPKGFGRMLNKRYGMEGFER
jgi:HD superfamily phosphohydrolase